ncbi:MAG: hypothetical protein FD176_1280 [Rhodospirillaceae bacterium]|nr:MAG: hypothetical protein FD176_1280 [Rhodospirillaceae bacterium]TNC94102.1 MAG: Secreted protein [Stygiobacter sp.]
MRSVSILAVLGLFVAFFLDLAPADALSPSADNGAEVVARWCADCHMSQRADTPSFQTISARRSAADISTALAKPHARPMGGIRLNQREIDDVTAYIKGLGH